MYVYVGEFGIQIYNNKYEKKFSKILYSCYYSILSIYV